MTNSVKHWQDPVNLILGLWMLISPWVLGYSAIVAATTNAVILGILIALDAILAIYRVRAWKEWVNVVFGAWLIIAPWVLGFGSMATPMWNSLIIGAVVVILALWELGTDKEIGGWWSHAH